MLKIKEITFSKNVYDESMSHQVFSTANIYFTNAEPIIGAMLYWRENKDDEAFTKQNEYKFFYDMAHTSLYAAVKFPKYCTLTTSQRQELSFILLEQRGFIGSYSFQTNKNAASVFKIHSIYKQLYFPDQFNPVHFKDYFHTLSDNETDAFLEEYPYYTKAFVKSYGEWMQLICQAHPAQFEKYINEVQMTQLSYQNPYLTEQFILTHLTKMDWSTLQYNLPVLNRLSKPFRAYIIDELVKQGAELQQDFEERALSFIENPYFYTEDHLEYLPKQGDDNGIFGPFEHFTYDLGKHQWPGAEHLVTGIPSFAAQLYDVHGDRKHSNKEMDYLYEHFTAQQRALFEQTCELHWLNRYKHKVDWFNVCKFNRHLNEHFIKKHEKWIDYKALSENTQCQLSENFIAAHVKQFVQVPFAPLVLKSLTQNLYDQIKGDFELSEAAITKAAHFLSEEQIELLESLI